MTSSAIQAQLGKYASEYDTDNVVQRIEDFIYDYELELGNIACFFIYKKENFLELSFMTCPNRNIPRFRIDKRV